MQVPAGPTGPSTPATTKTRRRPVPKSRKYINDEELDGHTEFEQGRPQSLPPLTGTESVTPERHPVSKMPSPSEKCNTSETLSPTKTPSQQKPSSPYVLLPSPAPSRKL
jgi:hypothetical protein